MSVSTTNGRIGNAAGTLNNYGTISAGVNGGVLDLELGAGGTNQGTGLITVSNGDTLGIHAGGESGAAWTNYGFITADAGAVLGLDCTDSADGWHNASGATLQATNSALDLGGNFTQADFGSFSATGSVVGIFGALTGNLDLTGQSGFWFLEGGTLFNGTLSSSGPVLTATSLGGVLNNYALSSVIDLTNNGNVAVTNGLTLNRVTLQIGDAASSSKSGHISFNGTQTPSGTNGSISFGIALGANSLAVNSGTVIIGHGVTIDGQLGQINGAGSLVNDGTILETNSGDAISISTLNFTNNSDGTVQALGGGAITINPSGATAWTNAGALTETNSTHSLGGKFT